MSTETGGVQSEKITQGHAENAGSPVGPKDTGDNAFEVFKITEDGVDFRNVSWIRAAIIFLKSNNIRPILTLAFPELTWLKLYSYLRHRCPQYSYCHELTR